MKRKLKWLTIVLAVLLLGFGTALLLWPRDRITAESWQKIRKSIFIHPPFLLGSATVRMTRTWRGFRMQRTAMEMDMQQYLKNRLQFPMDTLARHAGNWIAWSPDGARIVASSADPDALDHLIRVAGEDPEQCLIEGVPDTDGVIGGLNSP